MTSFMNAKPTRTMSNEIKVGDKVRVREDAPRMYLRTMSTKFLGAECGVFEIIDGNAAIASGRDYIAIPLKYLIKVEDEAKEPKFKRGDKVVSKPPFVEKVWTVFGYDDKMPYMVMVGDGEYINERNLEPYTESAEDKIKIGDKVRSKGYGLYAVVIGVDGDYITVEREDGIKQEWQRFMTEVIKPNEPTTPKYKKGDRVKFKNIYELQKVKDKSYLLVKLANKEATITAVEDNGFYRVDIDPSIGGINDDMIECKVEPKEQTEAEEDARIRQMEAELDEFRKAELDRILHPEKPTFEVTIDNVAMNWQRYEADLAKEIALKVANKYSDPKEAADYAVSVAKSVVEGLKRK